MIVPSEFETWWRSVLKARGVDSAAPETSPAPPMTAITTPIDSDASPEQRWIKPLSIAEAKSALAQTFGVSPDKVEITIRG
jgi:hypothetical protein